jgi:hypothetical protein
MTYRSATQPLCRCCGNPIAKQTDSKAVRDPRGGNAANAIAGPLYSKADCQRLVNGTVVSVSYHPDSSSIYGPADPSLPPVPVKLAHGPSYETERHRQPDQPRLVSSFTVWDGESYVDEFFCNGKCATRFAYVMARAGYRTTDYDAAVKRDRTGRAA